jgi:hypothetical protein
MRKADFDQYRAEIKRSAAADADPQHQEAYSNELGAASREYETIKAWWDWPERSDCQVVCLGRGYIVVFDEARSLVYVALGDN